MNPRCTWITLATLCIQPSLAQAGDFSVVTESKLHGSDTTTDDRLGSNVAVDQNSVLIAAPTDDDGGASTGSVYVLDYNGAQYSETKLTAGDALAGDAFGTGLAVDQDLIVVGAYQAYAEQNRGKAYVFTRTASGWSQQARLTADDRAPGDSFGRSVAVSGTTVAVASPLDDDMGADSGSVYIFEFDGQAWTQRRKINAPDGAAADQFGTAVALSGDTLAVGATGQDSAGTNAGAVYVFQRTASGWVLTQKLLPTRLKAGDAFGGSVALDGDQIIGGASGDDTLGASAGAVYIFERGQGPWTERVRLLAQDGQANDRFGYWVDIDLNRTVVGAFLNSGRGSAYVFERRTSGWTMDAKLEPSTTTQHFGTAVGISGDRIVAGASYDNDRGYHAGAAFLYQPKDSDLDGLSDGRELQLGTDPLNPDTDNDGLGDGTEVDLATCLSPLNPDSDADGLRDGAEGDIGSDPCNPDSDGDGIPDGSDPTPITPGVDDAYLASLSHALVAHIAHLTPDDFSGNFFQQIAKLRATQNVARVAHANVVRGKYRPAQSQLTALRRRTDGRAPDWVAPGSTQQKLDAQIGELLRLIGYEL